MKKRMLLVLVMSVSFTPLVFAVGSGAIESSGAGQELAMQVPAPANSCPYSNYVKPEYPSSPTAKQAGQKHDAGKLD